MRILIFILILLFHPFYLSSQIIISEDEFTGDRKLIMLREFITFDYRDRIFYDGTGQRYLENMRLENTRGTWLQIEQPLGGIYQRNRKVIFWYIDGRDRWRFFRGDVNSVLLLVDGELYKPESCGKPSRKVEPGYGSEFATPTSVERIPCEYSLEFVKQLSEAKEIKFRLVGSNQTIEGTIPEIIKPRLREFYDKAIQIWKEETNWPEITR